MRVENVPFRIRQNATTHGCPPSRKAALNHSSMKKPSTRPSSLLKNLESGAFSVFLLGLRAGRSGCVRLLATVSRVVSGCGLRRQQFGNADQIVGDQIEHEIGSDTGSAAMFGLAHRAVLLTPAEDAFGHRPARLRNAIAFVPRGASVDGALAALAG